MQRKRSLGGEVWRLAEIEVSSTKTEVRGVEEEDFGRRSVVDSGDRSQ